MAQVQLPEGPSLSVASLYVGDLKSNINEQTLWNTFAPYGQVLSVKICRNSQNQVSLGYGYVNFRTQPEADKAMKAVNFTNIDGRACRVMWSQRDPTRRKCGVGNLFIKNIDPVLDTKSLYDAFSAFGTILSCKIACDEYGLSKGYGFIQFTNQADADQAKVKSNGVPFMKKKIFVTNFIPRNARVDAKPINPNHFTNVFIKNLPDDFTSEELREEFSKFGEITSCVVQSHHLKDEAKCFGFINFSSPESACSAVSEMNGIEFKGQKLVVCKAMKKLERAAYLKKLHEDRKREIFKQYEKLNLYVKNFDENITDEKLIEIFSPHGKIISARIMKDEANKSRGFGFVCYNDPEEARVAIDELNAKVVGDRPLYVSYAQNKEDRRRMIEQRTYDNSIRASIFHGPPMPIVYQPPGPIPYPPPYTRLQGHIRQPRGMNPSIAVPSYQVGPAKGGYAYQQQANPGQHPSHYRHPRVAGGHPQNTGRHPQGVNQKNVHLQQQVAQASVNHVAAENQQKGHKENSKHFAKHQPDRATATKDRIFGIVQRMFRENSFDMNLLNRIAGVTIEYFSDSSSLTSLHDNDIKDAVISAYMEYRDQAEKGQ